MKSVGVQKAYNTGYNNYHDGLPQDPPKHYTRQEKECYRVGWLDASNEELYDEEDYNGMDL